MSKVDTREWKEFKVGEFFQCDTTFNIPSKNDLIEGNIPYITRSSENNGLSGYCGNIEKINKGNCITIGAEGFFAFYQKDDFVAGNKVYTIRHDKITKYSAYFIVSCLNILSSNYSFNNARVLDKINQEIIKLPIDREGNPDRAYMENYMKNLEDKGKTKLQNLILARRGVVRLINTNLWKEFKVGELLQMQHQIELSPIDAFNNNMPNDITYPFYGQSSENNGIIDFYYLGENLLNNKDSDHCIMIHSNTHLAYHVNTPFYLKDGHGATTIFTNDNLNKFSVLFLIAVLNKTMDRLFDYDIKATKEKLKNLIVKLPVDNEGNPNRAYMESYMKNLMEKNQKKLQSLH